MSLVATRSKALMKSKKFAPANVDHQRSGASLTVMVRICWQPLYIFQCKQSVRGDDLWFEQNDEVDFEGDLDAYAMRSGFLAVTTAEQAATFLSGWGRFFAADYVRGTGKVTYQEMAPPSPLSWREFMLWQGWLREAMTQDVFGPAHRVLTPRIEFGNVTVHSLRRPFSQEQLTAREAAAIGGSPLVEVETGRPVPQISIYCQSILEALAVTARVDRWSAVHHAACQKCGNIFETTAKRKRFCEDRCAKNFHNSRWQAENPRSGRAQDSSYKQGH